MSIKCYEFLVTECKILDAGLSECGILISDCRIKIQSAPYLSKANN
jgi:hypothetical protein